MARMPGTRPVILDPDDNPTTAEVEVQERWKMSKYKPANQTVLLFFLFFFLICPTKYILA